MRHVVRIFLKITGFLSTLIFFKPKVIYVDKKLQKRHIMGSGLIVSNHKGPLDFILMMLLFPFRSLHCVVGEQIFKKSPWFVNWLLKMFGAIRADRDTSNPQFIVESIEILKRGGVVEIYPEGRFPPKNSKMLPFALSTVYIALQTGVKIIPVYHAGRYGLFRREKVVIGTPLELSKYSNEINPSVETLKELTVILENNIASLEEMCKRNEL